MTSVYEFRVILFLSIDLEEVFSEHFLIARFTYYMQNNVTLYAVFKIMDFSAVLIS